MMSVCVCVCVCVWSPLTSGGKGERNDGILLDVHSLNTTGIGKVRRFRDGRGLVA